MYTLRRYEIHGFFFCIVFVVVVLVVVVVVVVDVVVVVVVVVVFVVVVSHLCSAKLFLLDVGYFARSGIVIHDECPLYASYNDLETKSGNHNLI
jgi:hypothetical protein